MLFVLVLFKFTCEPSSAHSGYESEVTADTGRMTSGLEAFNTAWLKDSGSLTSTCDVASACVTRTVMGWHCRLWSISSPDMTSNEALP